ncbi:polyprenyl synthetase family protein [Bacillota bacterium LX-D]|nr:polyprenyl synthetase family protein [Bacillota bacterium LX-D]
MNLKLYLQQRKDIINQALEQQLPSNEQYPQNIYKAMRHSIFAGGKRIRPILTLATCELISDDYERAIPAACAIECIHTYSLIHDDLPAMDNDDYRRGVPTCHKVYGEAIAILAGDALLTYAFQILAEDQLVSNYNPAVAIRLIHEISSACGPFGLIGGQVLDIESENKKVDEQTLKYIHQNKTGALITTSIRAGAILGGATEEQLDALTSYGKFLGLAFQITDDILDIEGSIENLGKQPGSDLKNSKVTFPAVYGLEEAKVRANKAVEDAIDSLHIFGDKSACLKNLAKFILERSN